MALEFEKLSQDVSRMARGLAARAAQRDAQVALALRKMEAVGVDWPLVENALAAQKGGAHESSPPLRTAEPLHQNDRPLHGAASPPDRCPSPATLIAVDGSQILPDRHAPFLYYLLHVGGLVYYHGRDVAPEVFSEHELVFDERLFEGGTLLVSASTVSARRDLAEIEALAGAAWAARGGDKPLVAMVDQRLLYRPVGQIARPERARIVQAWQQAMTKVHDSGGWLIGYVDRPRTSGVVSLLQLLPVEPGVSLQGLVDIEIFAHVLEPGERSKLFVTISQENETFRQADPANEVCFFYLNTARPGSRRASIARIDVPRWVADDAHAVDAVHALLLDQCWLWRDYPYVLTRADEIAVVGRRDQENLERMIANALARDGIDLSATAKQTGKDIARAGKTRHGL
jgi:hypothetical protein